MLNHDSNTIDTNADFAQLVLDKLDEICFRLSKLEHPDKAQSRTWLSTSEVAEKVGKSPYTVREWCRLKRIQARKRDTGFGSSCEWEVSVEELERYSNHGLLPIPTKY